MKANMEKVQAIAQKVAQDLGYQIYQVGLLREGTNRILRITIDHENGISHDDCERFSRSIDQLLDHEDPIPFNYYLEISSPGLYRELQNDEQLQRFLGSYVKIVCKRAFEGSRTHKGDLKAFSDEMITLLVKEHEMNIPREIIKTIHLDIP